MWCLNYSPFSGISYLILFYQTMHCLQSVMCLARHTGNEKTLQLRNLNACLAVLKCFLVNLKFMSFSISVFALALDCLLRDRKPPEMPRPFAQWTRPIRWRDALAQRPTARAGARSVCRSRRGDSGAVWNLWWDQQAPPILWNPRRNLWTVCAP